MVEKQVKHSDLQLSVEQQAASTTGAQCAIGSQVPLMANLDIVSSNVLNSKKRWKRLARREKIVYGTMVTTLNFGKRMVFDVAVSESNGSKRGKLQQGLIQVAHLGGVRNNFQVHFQASFGLVNSAFELVFLVYLVPNRGGRLFEGLRCLLKSRFLFERPVMDCDFVILLVILWRVWFRRNHFIYHGTLFVAKEVHA
ncbi:hypothetical protein ACOSQ3_027863 [Xanthoceras sorbifolium]